MASDKVALPGLNDTYKQSTTSPYTVAAVKGLWYGAVLSTVTSLCKSMFRFCVCGAGKGPQRTPHPARYVSVD